MAICFYWNDKGIGGVPVEYSLLINNICSNVQVKLFTARDSFLLKHIQKKEQISIYIMDEISEKELSRIITEQDIMVITTFPEFLYRYKINCKIWFWNVFPTTILDINQISFFFSRSNCQKMLDTMMAKNGIGFMDDTGINSASRRNIHINYDVSYFPIIVEDSPYLDRKIILDNEIHIAYIGRAILWKVMPVLRIIQDIEKFLLSDMTKVNIKLTIITDDKSKFLKLLAYNTKVQIDFVEQLSRTQLNLFLIHHCDLCMAMGTSCLDAAKLGVPSIVLDYSNTPFPDGYRYTWLYNSKNYCMGRPVREKVFSDEDFLLEDFLCDFFAKKIDISIHAEKCYSHVKLNHTVEIAGKLLVDYCLDSQLTTLNLLECTPIRRKQWWLLLKYLRFRKFF